MQKPVFHRCLVLSSFRMHWYVLFVIHFLGRKVDCPPTLLPSRCSCLFLLYIRSVFQLLYLWHGIPWCYPVTSDVHSFYLVVLNPVRLATLLTLFSCFFASSVSLSVAVFLLISHMCLSYPHLVVCCPRLSDNFCPALYWTTLVIIRLPVLISNSSDIIPLNPVLAFVSLSIPIISFRVVPSSPLFF